MTTDTVYVDSITSVKDQINNTCAINATCSSIRSVSRANNIEHKSFQQIYQEFQNYFKKKGIDIHAKDF